MTNTLPGAYRPCINGDMNAAAPGRDTCIICLENSTGMDRTELNLPSPEDFQAQALAAIPEGIDPDRPTGKARKRPPRRKAPSLELVPVESLTPLEKLEAAKRELSETIMPLLELFFRDNPPQAALWFLRSAAMLGLDTVGAAVKSLADDGEEEAPAALEALACVMGCVTFSTRGLVALGDLPQAALDDIEKALADNG